MTVRLERKVTRFLPRVVYLLLALLLTGCGATTQPREWPTAINGVGIAQTSPFRDCELRTFVAWDAAHQVILFHETEEQLLAGPNIGEFQVALYREIFMRLKQGDLHDYNRFAAHRFLICSQRASMPIHLDEADISTCLARLDIVMVLRADMLAGRSEAESKTNVIRRLKSRQLYPVNLIDALAPKVYSAPTAGEFYELRRSVFESCLAL